MTGALRGAVRALVILAALVVATTSADAQPPGRDATPRTASPAPRLAQGIAVVASGPARDDAFSLARAVYASPLRPRGLDELRARVLAGDPPPPAATKDLRDLAELRAGVHGEDAASRRLLAEIAQQLDVQGLLVVARRAPSVDAGALDADAALPDGALTAKLFLTTTGNFDAARYEPEGSDWRGTVASLASRFPAPPPPARARLEGPPPKLPSEGKGSAPFYMSPWLWGAVGAAALVGGFFFFAAQDTSDDAIHLQMRVPR